MKSQNGMMYPQNYDVILKWMADALCGQTLEVIGLKTGRIVEVFQFEPSEIAVKTGRVDIMIRDDKGNLYHVEEQRNLSKEDMYRFAAYHFMGAKKWENMTDIIIASGNVYSEKVLETQSGKYTPVVLDLSQRDGKTTLEQIRNAVQAGDMSQIMELIFVPLYGKEDKEARRKLAEEVIEFETSLHKAEKMPLRFLAATLVMANKVISKEKLNEMWEVIKMLDVIELAREKGLEEGKDIGLKEGKDIGLKEGKDIGLKEGKDIGLKEGIVLSREMLLDALIETFGVIPESIAAKIQSLNQPGTLKSLLRQALRCKELNQFADILDRLNGATGYSA